MAKGKSYGDVKSNFFNERMNSGKSHAETKKDWKSADERKNFDYSGGADFNEDEKDPNDPGQDYAKTLEDF